MLNWWQILLSPFGLLYDLITRVRNLLYDQRIKKTVRFDANVIGIGNLAIGGTGKTPMVQCLIQYFHSKDWKVATLSRGYGRKTKGFRLANLSDTPESIGDEPYMYYQAYGHKVPVSVGEERDLAISELLLHHQDTHVVVLDDAFQHRRIRPTVNIMLTTYDRLLTSDFVLPMGMLREARIGARRADIVIVTKCPVYLSEAEQVGIRYEISKYTAAKVFYTSVVEEAPVSIFENGQPIKHKVLAIAGIAHPKPFFKYLKRNYQVKMTHRYADHHRYTERDIRDIIRELDDETTLITTEKDMVKLKRFGQLKSFSCYYVPVSIQFLKDETLFYSYMESFLKNYEIAGN